MNPKICSLHFQESYLGDLKALRHSENLGAIDCIDSLNVQWIASRENLQEALVFPSDIEVFHDFPSKFPLNQSKSSISRNP